MIDCQTVMRPIKTTLYAEKPLGTAIDFMMEKHMGLVPVVDKDGIFVGELAGDRIMKAMLPKTLNIFRGMKKASFLRENKDDLRERMAELRDRPVSSLMDRNVPVVHPDTPLIDALMLLSQKHNVVPVVDKETRKLLGAISFFTILDAMEKD